MNISPKDQTCTMKPNNGYIKRTQKLKYLGEILTPNNNKKTTVKKVYEKWKLHSDCARKLIHPNAYPIKLNLDTI